MPTSAAASSTRRNSSTFWTQCAQQGYHPKIMTPPKALLFPSAVEALGDRGTGISTEVWWSQHHPFKSGLTGQTAQQFCDAYTAATGKQWTQPIGFKHACLEVAVDALKRAKKLDAASIRDAIADDRLPFAGRAAHLEGRRPTNPVKNVCTTPLVGGQWKPGKKFKYDLNIVFNKTAPNIPLDSPFEADQVLIATAWRFCSSSTASRNPIGASRRRTTSTLAVEEGEALGRHRPERRRQIDHVQPHHRRCRARRRPHRLRRRRHHARWRRTRARGSASAAPIRSRIPSRT